MPPAEGVGSRRCRSRAARRRDIGTAAREAERCAPQARSNASIHAQDFAAEVDSITAAGRGDGADAVGALVSQGYGCSRPRAMSCSALPDSHRAAAQLWSAVRGRPPAAFRAIPREREPRRVGVNLGHWGARSVPARHDAGDRPARREGRPDAGVDSSYRSPAPACHARRQSRHSTARCCWSWRTRSAAKLVAQHPSSASPV